ncbi:chaplin [Peterkaempfera griseoplana]|uniref:chaplin n=1 Tax=Peterkaempfera griseoplana TaxID=66896 RepID=UPI0006E3877B|nr:chaplin [Peterkaempfera griseoplana]
MKAKKIAAVVAATGGLVLAGAGAACATGGGAVAEGAAVGSPGVLSGNVIQVPVHVPVNVCGNTINVIGLLNPTFGNTCLNY